ncbi:metallopeptidase family protein [Microlunatus flavus]|nr:metallopeptidase family protein [Microlunatus flavus]
MSKRRDRHGRGLRGPLALPNQLGVPSARPPRPATRVAFFDDAVDAAVDRVARQCPDALTGTSIGVEDVPGFDPSWAQGRVPLASAVGATGTQGPRVVLYRRPLEHRAASRRGLRILVYRTVVEQLSALTGRSVDEIDPDGLGDEDDD